MSWNSKPHDFHRRLAAAAGTTVHGEGVVLIILTSIGSPRSLDLLHTSRVITGCLYKHCGCCLVTRIYLLLRLGNDVCQTSSAGGELAAKTLCVWIIWLGRFERVDLLYHSCNHPWFLEHEHTRCKTREQANWWGYVHSSYLWNLKFFSHLSLRIPLGAPQKKAEIHVNDRYWTYLDVHASSVRWPQNCRCNLYEERDCSKIN